MQTRRKGLFITIHTEGSILPPDLLQKILGGGRGLGGLDPDDYHLGKSERLNEAINRSWNRLQGVWTSFKAGLEKLSTGDLATTHTRERWLLILFQELGYGRLQSAKAVEIEGKSYPISHFWQQTPIHLVGCRVDPDRRSAGVAGAARTSPHSLVQELLNRSSDHLWAFISNGFILRILRDNVSLTRQAYVEFDLQVMMDGEVYADFSLLWLLCHQSRIEAERPAECWLEKWSRAAQEQGTRALDQLRSGVEDTISILGRGFLAHPANRQLREKLYSGELETQDFYRQILRLVYRLIFFFVAEDRDLLLDPKAPVAARERYIRFYSTTRIRRLAERRRGTKHADLFQGLKVVMEKLDSSGCPELGLPALGSFLWSKRSVSELADSEIANRDLLDAVRALAFTIDGHARRPVDYKNMGSEELGSVYESLLELHPVLDAGAGTFELTTSSGSERKTTGSYYTPSSLINCLLDSALDPVLDEAAKQKDPETAILNLKVCDPASGSGHFLIAAAHRMAKRLAAVRTGDDEPAPEAYRTALRDVIGRCIYGVDVNEMAVELCKVSLWMEALEPGKPLSFLDHRILCGNSLLGATPALLIKGIPDEAFKPIEGDLKEICSDFKRRNKQEREGQITLLFDNTGAAWPEVAELSKCLVELSGMKDDTIDDISRKEERYSKCINSSAYRYGRLMADAWCAAFVWKKTKEFPYPITEEVFRKIEDNPVSVPAWMLEEIKRLTNQYQFFHWHLAFPDVFRLHELGERPENEQAGWSGGFDVVLGNPPWERIKLQEKEFFASRDSEIANALNAAARRRKIAELQETDPHLYQVFRDALRRADGESRLVRDTGKYPLCGRGDVNTYSIFAELKRSLLNPQGRVGCIVPSGIATDDTTKFFFRDLMDSRSLHSIYMFENEGKLFPGIDHRNKFALLVMLGSNVESLDVDIVFGVNAVAELAEKERHFTLSSQDIALINPNTRTCPIFRYRQDAELTKYIYRRIPVLFKEATEIRHEENQWGVKFATMFHMANDSGLFRTREQLEADGFVLNGNVFTRDDDIYLPLYEGKMLWHFDHRFGTYDGQTEAQANQGKLPELTPEQHRDPNFLPLPRYWLAEEEVKAHIPKRPELLASALEVPQKWRNEAVIKAFCYWAAGYYRKAGDEERTQKLLAVALRPSVADTQIDTLNKWLLDKRCERMQERFPLMRADVERITTFPFDSVPLAEELLERFSPHWFVAFRDVTSAVVLRTAVFSIIPKIAVCHKAPLAFTDLRPQDSCCFIAAMNSFALDYIARQSIGGSSMSYFILKQLPVIPPSSLILRPVWDNKVILRTWMAARVLELSQTAWDLDALSEDCECKCPPFVWKENRRFRIRAELDAAFFHLYLGSDQEWKETGSKELLEYFPTPRHAVEYIMNTFRILRERDEVAHGYYCTKDTILEIYDEMTRVSSENAAALAAGREATTRYQTPLNPPPGPAMDADGNIISMYRWERNNWPDHIHVPHPAWEESLLSSWFAVCQKRWSYMEDEQIFPWDGREAYVYALIPYLIQEKPGETFEFYRDAALLASRSNRCETLLINEELRSDYHQAMNGIDWLDFPDGHRIRPREIRERLQNKRIIQTDPSSGATVVHNAVRLPPLPKELRPLLPLILKAAENLDNMQSSALKDAKAAKVNFTQDEVTNELQKLMVV